MQVKINAKDKDACDHQRVFRKSRLHSIILGCVKDFGHYLGLILAFDQAAAAALR